MSDDSKYKGFENCVEHGDKMLHGIKMMFNTMEAFNKELFADDTLSALEATTISINMVLQFHLNFVKKIARLCLEVEDEFGLNKLFDEFKEVLCQVYLQSQSSLLEAKDVHTKKT